MRQNNNLRQTAAAGDTKPCGGGRWRLWRFSLNNYSAASLHFGHTAVSCRFIGSAVFKKNFRGITRNAFPFILIRNYALSFYPRDNGYSLCAFSAGRFPSRTLSRSPWETARWQRTLSKGAILAAVFKPEDQRRHDIAAVP